MVEPLNETELKKEITEKKERLSQLKRDGFFGIGDRIRSQKFASLESRRRREEIRILGRKLLELRNEQNRNTPE